MRTWRYTLLTLGCFFATPIVLFLLRLVFVFPDDGFLQKCLVFFYIVVGDWLYQSGALRFLSSTSGHMPHLTPAGAFSLYMLPASLFFIGFHRLRGKSQQQSTDLSASSQIEPRKSEQDEQRDSTKDQ